MFFCIYTKNLRESSGQQTHRDDDIYGIQDDDPEEKRQRIADGKSALDLFSTGQIIEEDEEDEPDIEEDETLDGDLTARSSVAPVALFPSSKAAPPPEKLYLQDVSKAQAASAKKKATQASMLSYTKAPPVKAGSSKTMSSAEAMIPPTLPNESQSISTNGACAVEDGAIVMSSSIKSRGEIEALCKEDPTGDRPAGALAKVTKFEERDEFETEDGVIQIFSPAKAEAPKDTHEKDQARQLKIMAQQLKRDHEVTLKSKTLGKIMEQRCIMSHQVTRTKPTHGERSNYYLARIHVKHFK